MFFLHFNECLTRSCCEKGPGRSCVRGPAGWLNIPVTTMSFQYLPRYLWSVSMLPLISVPSVFHPSTLFSPLSSLFLPFPLFPSLLLVAFLCQRLSKQSRVWAALYLHVPERLGALRRAQLRLHLSAMSGILQISPGGSWAFAVCWVDLVPLWKGSKAGHIFRFSCGVEAHIMHRSGGCVWMGCRGLWHVVNIWQDGHESGLQPLKISLVELNLGQTSLCKQAQ